MNGVHHATHSLFIISRSNIFPHSSSATSLLCNHSEQKAKKPTLILSHFSTLYVGPIRLATAGYTTSTQGQHTKYKNNHWWTDKSSDTSFTEIGLMNSVFLRLQ